MGAIDRFLRRNRGQDNIKPLMKRLESAMLSAVKAAGGSAWYVPDDFLVLGPELIPDGAFSSSAGWNLSSGWSITGGKLVATSAATSTNAVINVGLVAGKNYLITYDIDSITAGATTPIANGATSTQQTTSGQKVSIITPAGSSGNVGINSSSATALTAVFDNFSVREILSAKDYQSLSSGLPSFLGGTVGFALEANAYLGPEKVADPNLTNAGAWAFVQPTSGIGEMVAGGGIRLYTADGTAVQASAAPGLYSEVGKFYRIDFEIASVVSGGFRVDFGGATGIAFSVPGKYTIHVQATAVATFVLSRATSVATDVTIKSVSVKEVIGGGVSQSTTANRPTITRIPRKLGPELLSNGDFSNGTTGWAISSGSALANVGGELEITANGSTSYPGASQVIQTTVGKTYQVTVKSRRGTSTSSTGLAISRSGGVSNLVAVAINASTTTGQYTTIVTSDWAAWNVLPHASGNPASAGTVYFDDISVREVLEWSYALTFDGTHDSLAAPASIIGSNLSQPYTMIAWGRPGSIGATRRMVGDGLRAIGIDAAGKVGVIHNGPGDRNGPTVVAQGQPVIIEVTWDGSTSNLYLNGAVESSGAHAAPTGTAAATAIGQYGLSTAYWQGEIGGAVVCPAVMTDAQRSAVRKFAAARMGLSL